MYKLLYGDCLKRLRDIPPGSVDLVYADPPFGTTQCRWDSIIDLPELWPALRRVARPGAAIVLHCAEPFTSVLIVSNLKDFRYRWTWNKMNRSTGFLDAKRRPLRIVEDLAVFSFGKAIDVYNPQKIPGRAYDSSSGKSTTENYGKYKRVRTVCDGLQYPRDLLNIPADNRKVEGRVHRTQKPLAIAEYVIKTYSHAGDTVLDFTMGSGTSGVAARMLGRKYYGVEKDKEIFGLAVSRVSGVTPRTPAVAPRAA